MLRTAEPKSCAGLQFSQASARPGASTLASHGELQARADNPAPAHGFGDAERLRPLPVSSSALVLDDVHGTGCPSDGRRCSR